MVKYENIPEIISFSKEKELDNIINSCHRTVDWSVSLHFKNLTRSVRFLAEKIIDSEKLNFYDFYTRYIVNHCDIAQLVDDIQAHINGVIIQSCHNDSPPQVALKTPDITLSADLVTLLVDEQKSAINISRQTVKLFEQLTVKSFVKITPWWVPKKIVSKAGITLAKTIVTKIEAGEESHRRNAVDFLEKQLTGILNGLEKHLKDQLKYQLSVHFYNWFDQKESLNLSSLGKVI